MSKKDKEIPSKEVAQEKIAEQQMEEGLNEGAQAEGGAEPAKQFSEPEIQELIAKAAAVEQAQEKLIRLQADFENHRKRLVREKEEFLKFANVGLLEALIPVLDNFDLALLHARQDHDPKHIVQGVEMIRKMFGDVLKKQGIEVMEPLNEKFDPHKHEAIAFEETDNKEEGMIVAVIQAGYLLHGRLIRPATVKITKKKAQTEENK